jgi:hypothetical protein
MSDMEKSEKSLNMAFERVIYIYTTNPVFFQSRTGVEESRNVQTFRD